MRFAIRKITKEDNRAMANIIRTVMPEFGASGQGFAIHDNEVDSMFEAYTQPRCAYYVCAIEGMVVGGGGIGPLAGGDENICELKKMYFLPAGRGKGFGKQVLLQCLKAARNIGFEFCYLETFNTMQDAMRLYEKAGFKKIPGPLGNTGHFACDTFYLIELAKV
jgi:putative acetyltransferase